MRIPAAPSNHCGLHRVASIGAAVSPKPRQPLPVARESMQPLAMTKPIVSGTIPRVRWTERVEAALERGDEDGRDQLATIKKLLALTVHPGTPTEEAATADAKAEELLDAYAEGLSGAAAGAIANANWDKAAERRAPYEPHKLVTTDRRWAENNTALHARAGGGRM